MNHPFTGYAVCRNNFFNNPYKVIEISKKQTYTRKNYCPGQRTENILMSNDPDTRNFAMYLANRVRYEVFPGIDNFMMDINFHINDVYEDTDANTGWIHNDMSDLAGLVYLTPELVDFESGTSIFDKKLEIDLPAGDIQSRQEFNLSCKASDQYLKDLKENWTFFNESVRFGNRFNRLVAYDAKLYHRPNKFITASNQPRLSVLFFIKGFSMQLPEENQDILWRDE